MASCLTAESIILFVETVRSSSADSFLITTLVGCAVGDSTVDLAEFERDVLAVGGFVVVVGVSIAICDCGEASTVEGLSTVESFDVDEAPAFDDDGDDWEDGETAAPLAGVLVVAVVAAAAFELNRTHSRDMPISMHFLNRQC